jgi:WD40 repeat protein
MSELDDDFPAVEEDFPELPPDDEDDVQAIVRAMARGAGAAVDGSALPATVAPPRTEGGAAESVPGSADDFIRNFLIRSRMFRSLDAFNTEFYELKARRALPGDELLRVPDAYSANARLEEEIAKLRVELVGAQELAGKAQGSWDRFRRERDFHRMHHRRVVQEKNKLIVDLRRLKTHYDQYEPTMAELRTKYELAMKEKALMRLERDRHAARALALETALRSASGSDAGGGGGGGSVGSPPKVTGGGGGGSGAVGGSGAAAVAALAAAGSGGGRRPAGGVAAPTALSAARAAETRAAVGATKRGGGGGGDGSLLTDARLPPDADVVNPYFGLVFEPAHADGYRLTGNVRAHAAAVTSLSFHPTKAVVASSSDDATWRLWAVQSAADAELVMNGDGHKTWVSGVAFHPGGLALATCAGDGLIKLWSLSSASCTATLADHTLPVWAVAWHHGGDFLVSASMDQTAKMWDAHTGKVRQSFRSHVDSVNAVQFQAYSSNLVTASGDKTVSMWDARSGLCVQTFYGHTNAVNDVQFSLRGDSIVSCDADGSVRLWDVRMVTERASASVGRQAIHGVAIDRSGSVIATACDDGVVRVFDGAGTDAGGLGVICSLRGHEDACQAVAFDPSAQYLLSAASDATVKIWSEGVIKGVGLEMGQ